MSIPSHIDVWIPLLKYKARVLDAANNEEAAQELLNLFSTARGDYLCKMPIGLLAMD